MTPSEELDQPVDFAFLADVFPFIGQTYNATPAPLQPLYQAIWEAGLDCVVTWLNLQAVLLSASAGGQKQRLAATILPLTDIPQAMAVFFQARGTARYAQRQQCRRNLAALWGQLAPNIPLKAAGPAFGKPAQACLAYLQAQPVLPPLGGRTLKRLVDSFAPAVYLMDRAHAEQVNLKWELDEWGAELFTVAVVHAFATERTLGRLAAVGLAHAGQVFDAIGVFFAVEYPTLEKP